MSWLPSSAADGVYNESVLEGFVDEADEAVYREAAALFNRNQEAFGRASRRRDRVSDALLTRRAAAVRGLE